MAATTVFTSLLDYLAIEREKRAILSADFDVVGLNARFGVLDRVKGLNPVGGKREEAVCGHVERVPALSPQRGPDAISAHRLMRAGRGM